MPRVQSITPCLWFDSDAEAAARYYVDIFPDSRIDTITRYGEAGRDVHGRPAGSVLTVAFVLDGHGFTALNGGPLFKFNEAISLQVHCDTQAELNYFWTRLSAGGDESAQQCGWLKDRFGLSWQVVPRVLQNMLCDPDPAKADRVMNALHGMNKLDIGELQRAYSGVGAR